MNYDTYIPMAKEIAKVQCGNNQFKHVSIILSNKSIVAIGVNSYTKTHPFNKFNNYSGEFIHSELDAYCKVRHKNTNLILLNFRFNNQYKLNLAKPCKYCIGWCYEVFDKIYYSTEWGDLCKLM
jgi:hypothetical protein